MYSEESLVKHLDMNPFSIPKLYQRHNLPVTFKTILVVWQAISIYTLTVVALQIKVFDIDTFLRKLSYMNILVSSLISIYFILSSRRESFPELNSSVDIPMTKLPGVIIPIIICFLVAHVCAFTILTVSSGITFMITYLLFASTNYTVTAIKHLVSQSFKAVNHKIVQSESPIDVAQCFRQVLAYDRSIEETYSFSVLIGLSGGGFTMCLSLVEYWKCYGLHKICDSFESYHPFISIVSQYYTMCQLLLLGIVSKQQLGYVNELTIEIDRRIVSDGYGLEYKQQLCVWMQELSYVSSGFSVLDFFTIDNTTFTDLCGFLVNCMMIFVQFMK